MPHQACLSTYANAGWLASYFRHDHRSIDPRQLEAPRSSLPLVWDVRDLEEGLAGHPAPARARQFIRDLEDSGIHSGVFLRIVSSAAPPGEHAVVSLQSGTRDRHWIGESLLGEVLTFGLSLHDFLSRHVQRPVPPAQGASGAGLPAMQQEVLRLVTHGLTDKQIADRLHVSAHTVDYHLRQLRLRFAVRNRVQLVHATEHLFAPA
jgi:DNA-binding CsgD family transcriptional regulator